MKSLIYCTLSTLAFFACPFILFAQPGPPPATPIDGGLGLLIVAGGAYGIKKISSNKSR